MFLKSSSFCVIQHQSSKLLLWWFLSDFGNWNIMNEEKGELRLIGLLMLNEAY